MQRENPIKTFFMKNNGWSDDYWLLLVQAFLRKPVGVKPAYSREMVSLAIELHVHPTVLATKMRQIATVPTPRVERILNTYRDNPRRLARAVKLLRSMKGFNNAVEFYDGVDVNETFETDFKPVADDTELTPIDLTLILQIFFQLTPVTMVAETPEVAELAHKIGKKPQAVADALIAYQHCDPYLNRKDAYTSPLLPACRRLWGQYATANPEILDKRVNELAEYYK